MQVPHSINNGMMWLDDGPAAARGGTESMLGSEGLHRMFDFVAAAAGMILLAPIFLVTSIAIKLDSDGPIFIREPRFGHGNRISIGEWLRRWQYPSAPNTTWPNSV